MSKEIDTKIECCEIWNSLKDKTKMIDFLINAKTEIDQLKQENETLFLQLSKQEIDEHKPVYCTLAGNDCKYLGKIKELKQQLAEKDKEIERLKDFIGCKGCVDVIKKSNEDQTQLAIQELEKLKASADKWFESWENSKYEGNIYDKLDVSNAYLQMSCEIDQQIKELKGEKQ